MADEVKRVDVGFQGGHVLALRTSDESLEKLSQALGDEQSGRWHILEAEESSLLIDLSQIVYVRRESGTHKVGF